MRMSIGAKWAFPAVVLFLAGTFGLPAHLAFDSHDTHHESEEEDHPAPDSHDSHPSSDHERDVEAATVPSKAAPSVVRVALLEETALHVAAPLCVSDVPDQSHGPPRSPEAHPPPSRDPPIA